MMSKCGDRAPDGVAKGNDHIDAVTKYVDDRAGDVGIVAVRGLFGRTLWIRRPEISGCVFSDTVETLSPLEVSRVLGHLGRIGAVRSIEES